MITYSRSKPCRQCGGTEFYTSNRLCKQCSNNRSKAYQKEHAIKFKAMQKEWNAKNSAYLKSYNQARYALRRQALPYIFAFYLMTRGAA